MGILASNQREPQPPRVTEHNEEVCVRLKLLPDRKKQNTPTEKIQVKCSRYDNILRLCTYVYLRPNEMF